MVAAMSVGTTVLPNRVTQADIAGSFWQLVGELDARDLITEFVQNDFDERATHTQISFEADRIVAEGNGSPVNEKGWERLSFVQGAGFEVEAKRGGIGIKNHGLDTGFQLGDTIRVLSGGYWTERALYDGKRGSKPHPNAFERPTSLAPPLGSSMPETGCRIEIELRQEALEVRRGEPIRLKPWSDKELRQLFVEACSSAHRMFIGLVHPSFRRRYTLELKHYSLGSAKFEFSVRLRKKGVGEQAFVRYTRRCVISSNVEGVASRSIRAEAACRARTFKNLRPTQVPSYFRDGRKTRVEVEWSCFNDGNPDSVSTGLGYPIAYPTGNAAAESGVGCVFRGPFRSDTRRHSPVGDDERNLEIREACLDLLADVIANELVPRWGTSGFALLLSPRRHDEIHEDAARSTLARIARIRALPTVTKEEALLLLSKKKAKSSKTTEKPKLLRDTKSRRCVIPYPKNPKDGCERSARIALARLCPEAEPQLDPRIDDRILAMLIQYWGETLGANDPWITFDEYDAFALAQGWGNQYFDWSEGARRKAYSNPKTANALLDLIEAVGCESDDKNDILLPDTNSRAVYFKELRSSSTVPSDVPGLDLPFILHPEVAKHSLLKRDPWRISGYDFSDFISDELLIFASARTRKRFWHWLVKTRRQRPRAFTASELDSLAELPIWPGTDGLLHRLGDLCIPPDRIAGILGSNIVRPSKSVIDSGLTSRYRSNPRYLRKLPNREEIAEWWESVSTLGQHGNWQSVEAGLQVLLQEPALLASLSEAVGELLAINEEGDLAPREELVRQSSVVRNMQVMANFLLAPESDNPNLDKLSCPLDTPTLDMLVETLDLDTTNEDALPHRLVALMQTEWSSELISATNRLSQLPIIPHDEMWLAPSRVAFKSNRGNHWGTWKISIPSRGLSQQVQRAYIHVGVTNAFPTLSSSVAYFRWLNEQDEKTKRDHVLPSLLHLVHDNGPRAWASDHPRLGIISAHFGREIRLASLNEIKRSRILIPDDSALSDEIRKLTTIGLAIHEAKEIREPLTQFLADIGVRSLRELAKTPIAVEALGHTTNDLPEQIANCMRHVQSERFCNDLPKLFARIGSGLPDLMRGNWRHRLSEVREVRLADSISATYSIGSKTISVDRDGGFDPKSSVLWLRSDVIDPIGRMLQLVAADRVFQPEAEPLHHQALRTAYYAEPLSVRSYRAKGPDEESAQPTMDQIGDEPDLVEAQNTPSVLGGHAPVRLDPARNLPSVNPPPTPRTEKQTSRSDRVGADRGRGEINKPQSRPYNANERADIEWIRETYAFHCQRCLAEASVGQLAPQGSYVEHAEQRGKLIETHHADLYAASGPRHLGNMVVLCHLHHQELGGLLSRDMITHALAGEGRRSESFGSTAAIETAVFEVEVPGVEDAVKLLFTEDHRAEWLRLAEAEAD